MKDRPSALGIAGLIAVFVGTTVGCAMLPMKQLMLLPYTNLPLIVVAKVPQVRLVDGRRGSSAVQARVGVDACVVVAGPSVHSVWRHNIPTGSQQFMFSRCPDCAALSSDVYRRQEQLRLVAFLRPV